MTSRGRLHDDAFAVTVAGDILANVSHANGTKDVKKVFEKALAMNGKVFIGIVLTPAERKFLLRWADDSAAEVTAWIWGARQRRTRRRRSAR
jgi:hypothetical protein